MPVRIYEIARRFGMPSKEVLEKAQKFGISKAEFASSTLDKITAEYLEKQIAAENTRGASEVSREYAGEVTEDESSCNSLEMTKLNELQMEDITSDVRLLNCYKNNFLSNLQEFYDLGELGRLNIRNFGKTTEINFQEALQNFCSKSGQKLNPKEVSIHKSITPNEILEGSQVLKKMNRRTWAEWNIKLKKQGFFSEKILFVCNEADLSWPSKSRLNSCFKYSEVTFGELAEFPINELSTLRGFGKVKLRTYIKAVAYLLSGKRVDLLSLSSQDAFHRIYFKYGLTDKQLDIIFKRLGKDCAPKILEEIARDYGFSRERARQIQTDAIKKLRSPYLLRFFSKYLDTKQTEIWYTISEGRAVISHHSLNHKIFNRLEFNDRLSMLVYSGEQIEGENITNVLRKFLSNRFNECASCWWNLDFDSEQLEIQIALMQGRISTMKMPIFKHRLNHVLVSEYQFLFDDILLVACPGMIVYNGYILLKRQFTRMRRAIDSHIILSHINEKLPYLSLKELHHEYTKMRGLVDPCSKRDIEIILNEFTHLFFNVGAQGYISIGLSEEIQGSQRLTVIEEEDPSDVISVLSPRIQGIVDIFVEQETLLTRTALYKIIKGKGFDMPIGSMYSYLYKYDEFLLFAPGLHGLAVWADKPEIIESSQQLLLNSKHCDLYMKARYAGEPLHLYPLWDYQIENKMANWAMSGENYEQFHALLSVIEPDKWNLNAEERSLWKVQKKKKGKYPSMKKVPHIWEQDLPPFNELLSALLIIQRENRISWIKLNYLMGRRLDGSNSLGTLGLLGLLGVINIPKDWRIDHSQKNDSTVIIQQLKDAYYENVNLNWNNGLLNILESKIEDGLENLNGWMRNFHPALLKAHFLLQVNDVAEVIKAFNEKHGHFDVPDNFQDILDLKYWISCQKKKRIKGEIHPKIEQALNSIDFDWTVLSKTPTSIRIKQLNAFNNEFGHWDVTYGYKDVPGLYGWVATQRKRKRQGTLNLEIERSLNNIGFDWEPSS